MQVVPLARYVAALGARDFVDAVADYHSTHVNPGELSLPPAFFGTIAQHFGRSRPLSSVAIVVTAYTPEGAIVRMRPQPDTCHFITGAEVVSFAKEDQVLDRVEAFLRAARDEFASKFRDAGLDDRAQRGYFRMLDMQACGAGVACDYEPKQRKWP